jgi:hypothetical protein
VFAKRLQRGFDEDVDVDDDDRGWSQPEVIPVAFLPPTPSVADFYLSISWFLISSSVRLN